MAVDTTLNLKFDIYDKLVNASKNTGKSISCILSKILKKQIECQLVLMTIDKAVSYQRRDYLKKWKKVHVHFENQDYETAIDLRKFTKKSVSFFFSIGIEKFLEKVLEELLKENVTDNYQANQGYFIRSKARIDGGMCFKIIWDYSCEYTEPNTYTSADILNLFNVFR